MLIFTWLLSAAHLNNQRQNNITPIPPKDLPGVVEVSDLPTEPPKKKRRNWFPFLLDAD